MMDNSFEVVVSQHVIEHLELETELIPLLKELSRVLKPQAEIWLSCPDMEKICQSYVMDKGEALLNDRQSRFPHFNLEGVPRQHMINILFTNKGNTKTCLTSSCSTGHLPKAALDK
ncbi:MAG: methyltransferase domain-containing protein [Bacteroidia bacterium]|nr:methyltransferase domain-containing protein [Bacteroidia bacterium]